MASENEYHTVMVSAKQMVVSNWARLGISRGKSQVIPKIYD